MCTDFTALVNSLNAASHQLWYANADHVFCKTCPRTYISDPSFDVLVIGCNPSDPRPKKDRDVTFNPSKAALEENLDKGHKYENRVLGFEDRHAPHPYYKAITQFLSDECGEQGSAPYAALKPWNFDLFFVRSTKQNKISMHFPNNTSKLDLSTIKDPFLAKQLRLSVGLLAEFEPRAIWVANGFCSDILRRGVKGLFNAPKFDGSVGFHRTDDKRRIPIFFSGMLLGQRALDIGSKERLRWHIAQAVKTGPK